MTKSASVVFPDVSTPSNATSVGLLRLILMISSARVSTSSSVFIFSSAAFPRFQRFRRPRGLALFPRKMRSGCPDVPGGSSVRGDRRSGDLSVNHGVIRIPLLDVKLFYYLEPSF
jgi:hypothetical protein